MMKKRDICEEKWSCSVRLIFCMHYSNILTFLCVILASVVSLKWGQHTLTHTPYVKWLMGLKEEKSILIKNEPYSKGDGNEY